MKKLKLNKETISMIGNEGKKNIIGGGSVITVCNDCNADPDPDPSPSELNSCNPLKYECHSKIHYNC